MKLVKICGVKTLEAAETAIIHGTDLVGCILVPNKPRTIPPEVAKQISKLVNHGRPKSLTLISEEIKNSTKEFDSPIEYFEYIKDILIENGPFLVGVFKNQSPEEVSKIAQNLNLDFIQLHGNENLKDYLNLGFGVIKRYVLPKDLEILKNDSNYVMNEKILSLQLLDSEEGGEGKKIDWEFIKNNLNFTKSILAGGLNPENVIETKDIPNILGYDVSGGVETNGSKDLTKITKFINAGKSI
ncbi:TRP1 [Candida pseudojiufengensis]|uniref:TRP1 n=1 Tax=Candida pseudojiufengensis TaxID=497109 RepID=UPI0022254F33|nr:TRP1 [Candida pseudojiufengensis]KAI5966304.1 TRP1 [Candida pseudojiufengensis]